ncbi:MAG: hypothetical protein ACPK85_01955 [Methanosarcina sp.]
MLSEGIAFTKPIFNFVQGQKSTDKFKPLFYLTILLCLLSLPGAAAPNWEISPENPVAGDVIEIKGTGFSGETVDIVTTFEKEVNASESRYEYLLEDVEISSDLYNRFTVQATGVEDLNVSVKMLLWMTKTIEADNGVATVSHENVPKGTYNIKLGGKAIEPTVKLKITALEQVKPDSQGNFVYEFNTNSVPPGIFEIKVGEETKQVNLKPSDKSGAPKESWNPLKSWNMLIAGILAGLVFLFVYFKKNKN